jgi:peptide/nickel transport system permease protein
MSITHVLFREALRPSSFPLVTLSGLSIGRLIGANIIVEQIFSLPGLGPTVVDAAQKSDYPLVQGAVLVIAVMYVGANLLVDVLYAVLDPRVRHALG